MDGGHSLTAWFRTTIKVLRKIPRPNTLLGIYDPTQVVGQILKTSDMGVLLPVDFTEWEKIFLSGTLSIMERRQTENDGFFDSSEIQPSLQAFASSVRNVYLHHDSRGTPGRTVHKHGIGTYEEAKEAINAIVIDEKRSWKKAIRDAGSEAQLVLLLSLLPNIEILDLRAECSFALGFPWTLAYLRHTAENAMLAKSKFPRLQAVLCSPADMYHFNRDHYGVSPTALACVMGLPALREVQMSRAWRNTENPKHGSELISHKYRFEPSSDPDIVMKSKITWPKRTSNVERLNFWHSVVDSMSLRNAVAACKNLPFFGISWAKQCWCDNIRAGIVGLIPSLGLQKHSLKMVCLTMGKWWQDEHNY